MWWREKKNNYKGDLQWDNANPASRTRTLLTKYVKQTELQKANKFMLIYSSVEIPDDISSIKKTKTGGGGGGSIGSSAPILRTLKMSNHGTGNDMISNSNGLGTSFALIFTDNNNNNNILETAVDTHRKTEKDGDLHSPSGT